MKPRFFLMTVFCLIFSHACLAQDHAAAAEQCIAENSGASSLDCLQKIYRQIQQEIAGLQKTIQIRLKEKRQAGDLIQTHYESAFSSLADASKKYAAFSERQCDFESAASGAAASGYGQVRWRCL
ncbi:MAG: hypothetical protein LBE32_03795, partial [Burkholderiales bacterium]|nr:hypothetical protein [Burkholderiales bacterium]